MIGAVLAVWLACGEPSASILWRTQSKTQGQSLASGETLKRKSPCLNVSPYPTDWWLPLGIRGCGWLRITDVTDSGLIICSRHSDSVDGAKKSKLEKKKKEGALGRERGYLHYAPHSTIWTAPGTGHKVWAKIELYKLVSYTKKNYQHNKIAFG